MYILVKVFDSNKINVFIFLVLNIYFLKVQLFEQNSKFLSVLFLFSLLNFCL